MPANSAIDLVEYYLSRAELQYARGQTRESIVSAKTALGLEPSLEKKTALELFIARAKSSLGEFSASNEIYRALIDENTYLPPIILGILHNNLRLAKTDKSKKNLALINLMCYTGNP